MKKSFLAIIVLLTIAVKTFLPAVFDKSIAPCTASVISAQYRTAADRSGPVNRTFLPR